MPGVIIAMGRLNRPSIMVYGGTIKVRTVLHGSVFLFLFFFKMDLHTLASNLNCQETVNQLCDFFSCGCSQVYLMATLLISSLLSRYLSYIYHKIG